MTLENNELVRIIPIYINKVEPLANKTQIFTQEHRKEINFSGFSNPKRDSYILPTFLNTLTPNNCSSYNTNVFYNILQSRHIGGINT